MSRLFLSCIIASFLWPITPDSHAVPLSIQQLPQSELDIRGNHWEDSTLLRQAVDHLKNGDRQLAKSKLAQFLKQSPNDPRGPELAGIILMEEKNYPVAVLSFERALTLNPKNPSALSKLGVALLLQNKRKEGEAALNRTIALSPGEPLARRYLGWLEEGRGNLNGAARHYLAALNGGILSTTRLTDIHLALGRIYSALGRNEQTIRLLAPLIVAKNGASQIVQAAQFQLAFSYLELKRVSDASKLIHTLERNLKPDNPELRFLQAYAQMDTNPASAREKLQHLAVTYPVYSGRVRLLIARSYAIEGKSSMAIKELESLASRVQLGDLPEVLTALVATHLSYGKASEAEKILTVYGNKYPNLPEISYLLAETKLHAGSPTQAYSLLQQLTVKNPTHAQAYALLGQIARGQNKLAEAEAHLRKALALDSNLANAWVNLAGVYISRKEFSKAEESLKQGLKINPGNALLQYELASIYDAGGKLRDANSLYRIILSAYPSYVPALNNLALNLAEEGDISNARKFSHQAYQLDKDNATIQDTYGWILVLNSEIDKGLPLLQQAIRALPNDSSVMYHYGASLIKSGKINEGKTYIQRAIAAGLPVHLRKKALALL